MTQAKSGEEVLLAIADVIYRHTHIDYSAIPAAKEIVQYFLSLPLNQHQLDILDTITKQKQKGYPNGNRKDSPLG